MRSKKIVAILADFPLGLINNNYPVPTGHYAVWLVNLYEDFANWTKYEIHWVVFSKAVSQVRHFEQNKQYFHVLPRISRSIGLCSFYLRERFCAAQELKLIMPDLLHAWGTEDCYALCGKDFHGKKLLSMQGILSAYRQRGSLSKFLQIQSLYEPYVLRSFGYISTESLWGKDRIHELSPDSICFLWEYAAEKRFFSLKRKLSPQPTCLMAGTDTPIKNVETAINAFSSPELAHVQLLIAGVSPANHPELPANVKALGRLKREEIAKLLQSSWCLLHPSLADTSPNIVKEALVVGLPCLVSTECGSKQYIEEGKSGFIVEPKDTHAITAGILKMTQSAKVSLQMGEYNHKASRQALSSATMMQKLDDIYQRLLSI